VPDHPAVTDITPASGSMARLASISEAQVAGRSVFETRGRAAGAKDPVLGTSRAGRRSGRSFAVQERVGAQWSDEELPGRIADGDRDAEAELVRRHRALVLATLRGRLRDAGRAEDLCQDALRVALERLRARGLRDPARLGAYLRAIAANLARREGRRHRLEGAAVGDPGEVADDSTSPEDRLLAIERGRRLRAALERLRSRDRALLCGLYLGDADKRSLCVLLGLSPAQFDVAKWRATRRLARLWKEGFTATSPLPPEARRRLTCRR
jgi:RNA polymerase sigma factor (sigma-70 family)